MFTESVFRTLRQNIRKHEEILIDEDDLAAAVQQMFPVETRVAIEMMKVKHARRKLRAVSTGGAGEESVVLAVEGKG